MPISRGSVSTEVRTRGDQSPIIKYQTTPPTIVPITEKVDFGDRKGNEEFKEPKGRVGEWHFLFSFLKLYLKL